MLFAQVLNHFHTKIDRPRGKFSKRTAFCRIRAGARPEGTQGGKARRPLSSWVSEGIAPSRAQAARAPPSNTHSAPRPAPGGQVRGRPAAPGGPHAPASGLGRAGEVHAIPRANRASRQAASAGSPGKGGPRRRRRGGPPTDATALGLEAGSPPQRYLGREGAKAQGRRGGGGSGSGSGEDPGPGHPPKGQAESGRHERGVPPGVPSGPKHPPPR